MSIKILTVDDSKTIRLIVTKFMAPYDCTVLEADNGVVGLAVANREKPNLIILDYTMPLMDGHEVLTRLRADPDLKATPVIMLTAEAGRDTVVKIARLGVRDYLIKPFKGEALVERVGRVVELKPKGAAPKARKRYDDPIGILVLDDKPAIVAQVQSGLADTQWKVSSAADSKAALDLCAAGGVDLVLASLSLPNDGAYTFYQSLRAQAAIASTPVIGMCVRTATADQTKAVQAGMAAVVNKPIDPADLKAKVARILALETSYRYFQQRDGVLALVFPKEFTPGVAQDVSTHLEGKLTGTVEEGGDKLVIDLTEIETASLPVVEAILSAIQSAAKLSLRCAVVATEAIKKQCSNYEESQAWTFAGTFEQALELLK